MPEQAVALARRFFEEVWNNGSDAAMDELVTADVVAHGLGEPGIDVQGLDSGFRPFYRAFRGAFPDIRFSVEDAVSNGRITAVRWTARMTHLGDHLGTPATNKQLCITGMTFLRIEAGKIAEGWNNWDRAQLTAAIAQ